MATDMLRAMKLVSRDEFAERLRQLILDRANSVVGPVGLYAERELPKRLGVPLRLFKQTAAKPRRAHGIGPEPVKSIRAYDPEVGSEGIVAQLISELKKQFGSKFVDHPGPDTIRKRKIRRIIIVTDLIGSGKRCYNYLEAAWRVHSVKSWWSSRSSKGIHFEVIAYSGTEKGLFHVGEHRSKPEAHIVARCPTIKSEFGIWKARAIRALCKSKAADLKGDDALGYDGTGALIAFAHGAPNNTPVMLHRSKAGWLALFPRRVTADVRKHFGATDQDQIRIDLENMRRRRFPGAPWITYALPDIRLLLSVMNALIVTSKSDEALCENTGLTLLEVSDAIKKAFALGWINGRRQLTDEGRLQIDKIRLSANPDESPLPKEKEVIYVPKSLRVPVRTFS